MTINCRGRLMDLGRPKIMGILNVTPDSFYDGGSYSDQAVMLQRVGRMIDEGADIIDIGGYSSRPSAEEVSEQKELDRLLPAIDAIIGQYPDAVLSIDTFRSGVARRAAAHGAGIINDISGGLLDPDMIAAVAELRLPYVMMHMKGTPQNKQQYAQYEDIAREVLYYFSERMAEARAAGISDVIVDPGFGFAKTVAHNYQLMQSLGDFSMLDAPLLVGISRKSMIYKITGGGPDEALAGTTALHMYALERGADILRVHDVRAAADCIKVWEQLQRANTAE